MVKNRKSANKALVGANQKITHLERRLDSMKQQSEEFENENNGLKTSPEDMQAQLRNEKLIQELNNTQQSLTEKTNELESTRSRSAELQQNLDVKTNELTKLTEERSQLEGKLNDAKQNLARKTSKIIALTEELERTKIHQLEEYKSIDNEMKAMLKGFEDVYAQSHKENEELMQELSNAQQSLAEKIDEFKSAQAQSSELKQDLDVKASEVIEIKGRLSDAKQRLDEKTKELMHTKAQLEKLQKNLAEKNSKMTQFVEELERTKVQPAKKEEKLGDTKKNVVQLEGSLKQANQKIDDLTRENNRLIKEKGLNNENTKLSAVATQSRKQGNYASASFILSGMFAVGASLTIPYLAACIALAVAASVFLAIGCCCLYKANSVLSNVEVDQATKSTNPVTV